MKETDAMFDYRKQTNPGSEATMAKSPHPPSDKCDKISTDPPDAPEFKPTPCAPPKCDCPDSPTPISNCMTDMITSQDTDITKGEKAKAFKTELQALLAKANAAKLDYTRDKFTNLC